MRLSGAAFYIPGLDGMRGIGFLLVFLSHSGVKKIPAAFAMSVFFFLSGYLITTLIRREYERTGRVSLKLFYFRRALRIFPPFYITMALALALAFFGPLPDTFRPSALISELVYLTNYYVVFVGGPYDLLRGTGVTWSLSVEEHFYLGFPLLAIFLLHRFRPRGQAAVLGSLCALALLWRLILMFAAGPYEHERFAWATDARLDSLLYGCLLGVWQNPCLDEPHPWLVRHRRWLYAPALGLPLITHLIQAQWFQNTLVFTLEGIGLLFLFHLVVTRPDRPWFRWLDWPLLQLLGVLSYSLYLVHNVVLHSLKWGWSGSTSWSRPAVAFILTLAWGLAMRYAVELPCQKARDRLRDLAFRRKPAGPDVSPDSACNGKLPARRRPRAND